MITLAYKYYYLYIVFLENCVLRVYLIFRFVVSKFLCSIAKNAHLDFGSLDRRDEAGFFWVRISSLRVFYHGRHTDESSMSIFGDMGGVFTRVDESMR